MWQKRHFGGRKRIGILPGQYYDAETGLHYNYYRDYNPSLGRYIQKDPIGFRGGINLYAYVQNNPVNYTDPSGLVKIYGRWCGPNWTGWQVGEYTPNHPRYYEDPVDNLDEACKGKEKGSALEKGKLLFEKRDQNSLFKG